MKRDLSLFLKDIIEQIDLIEASINGKTKDDFLENRELQDATARRLEIIGEATKNIPETVRKKYPDIEWKKIAGFRDIIIHTYFELDLDLIWEVIESKLSDLKIKVKKVLEDLEKEEKEKQKKATRK